MKIILAILLTLSVAVNGWYAWAAIQEPIQPRIVKEVATGNLVVIVNERVYPFHGVCMPEQKL